MGKKIIYRIKENFPKIWLEIKKNAYEREIQIINSAAEMKILLQYNVDGKIGKINAKEIKQSILNEIENMKSENNDIYEEGGDSEMVKLLKSEMESTRVILRRIEERLKHLEKKRKKKRNSMKKLPPIIKKK